MKRGVKGMNEGEERGRRIMVMSGWTRIEMYT